MPWTAAAGSPDGRAPLGSGGPGNYFKNAHPAASLKRFDPSKQAAGVNYSRKNFLASACSNYKRANSTRATALVQTKPYQPHHEETDSQLPRFRRLRGFQL